MKHLWLTLRSLYRALRLRIPGWRYPQTTYVDAGLAFPTRGELVQMTIFNLIKYNRFHQLLDRLNVDVVIRAGIVEGSIHLSVYRLQVKDGRNDHLAMPYQGMPGNDGIFHYLFVNRHLSTPRSGTSLARQYRFDLQEPVFSFKLPHTEATYRQFQPFLRDEGYLDEPLDDDASFATVLKEVAHEHRH